jgi:tRNA U34 5-carboxymethylaminomethyl modifying enzyme MnmG/GidA
MIDGWKDTPTTNPSRCFYLPTLLFQDQLLCWIAYTKSSLAASTLTSLWWSHPGDWSPRYCLSVEDKIIRFAEQE